MPFDVPFSMLYNGVPPLDGSSPSLCSREKIGGAHHLCVSMEAAIRLTESANPDSAKMRAGQAAQQYRQLATHVTGGMHTAFSFADLDHFDMESPTGQSQVEFIS